MIIQVSPATNQPTKSSRLKFLFILLCILICIISYTALYSNISLNWKLLQAYILITYPVEHTNYKYTNSSFKIPDNQKIRFYPNRRFVIFACSIHSKVYAYSFYAPLIAASWKRVGYETIVVFVGDFTLPNVLTARFNLTRSYLKYLGATIMDIQCNMSYAIKLSQLVRVFAGFLPDSIVRDDDYILTGDSDLMPLKPSVYIPTDGTDGFIFNAFCCGSFKRRNRTYRMFPMGHIYLKKKSWRAIVLESKQRAELLQNTSNEILPLLNENAILSFDMISVYARHEFKQIYDSNMRKGDSSWYMDQVLCSMLLTDYRAKHKDFKINERGRGGRLDRASSISYWNRDNFDNFGDAHLYHDSILKESNWKIFNKLLNALFDQNLVNLFNDYYRQYIIARG